MQNSHVRSNALKFCSSGSLAQFASPGLPTTRAEKGRNNRNAFACFLILRFKLSLAGHLQPFLFGAIIWEAPLTLAQNLESCAVIALLALDVGF